MSGQLHAAQTRHHAQKRSHVDGSAVSSSASPAGGRGFTCSPRHLCRSLPHLGLCDGDSQLRCSSRWSPEVLSSGKQQFGGPTPRPWHVSCLRCTDCRLECVTFFWDALTNAVVSKWKYLFYLHDREQWTEWWCFGCDMLAAASPPPSCLSCLCLSAAVDTLMQFVWCPKCPFLNCKFSASILIFLHCSHVFDRIETQIIGGKKTLVKWNLHIMGPLSSHFCG